MDDCVSGKEDFQALMRMDGFKDELLALRSQWVHERELRVVAATWNVAGIAEPPADVDLSDWLALERPADVYAIGSVDWALSGGLGSHENNLLLVPRQMDQLCHLVQLY